MFLLKRVFLFLMVNFLVVITISILLSVFQVQPFLTANGINYESLMVFCLIWGMGGAFISLLLSRQMAKWMMGVQLIDPQSRDPHLNGLVQTVYQLARSAGLGTMPEVGIYDSPEVNAFATGPTRSKALVAVSSGLLQKMNQSQLEGVLGHEISHIANGDMVTMTLIQGVVNAFVMFLARAVAFLISQALRSRDDDRSAGMSNVSYYLIVFVLEIIFMIIGSLVVAWFSRFREFRADAGGARLAGRDKMILALEALKRTFEIQDPQMQAASIQAFKISSGRKSWLHWFSTHPPLEERIARLESLTTFEN